MTPPADPAPAAGTVLERVVADLRDESAAVLELLSGLPGETWSAPTPADGWTVLDQVTHLAWFDDATVLALRDPAAFLGQRDDLLALGDGFPDVVAARHRHLGPGEALAWLTASRAALLTAYADTDPAYRMPWYGPGMGLASSATARLMETWAHGQDVADTVGLARAATARLRSVADLGVRTFAFAFSLHGRPAPTAPVRVELTGPGGELWTWGPADAADSLRGTALDFCLLVTQRRHLADTDLVVRGPVATAWTQVAQAYAGAAGPGRAAGPSRAGDQPPAP